jgi:hypothetical protein
VLGELLELGDRARRTPPPRLLDGDTLMAALGLGPGPWIGELLERVRDAQDAGIVRTPEEALAHAERALDLVRDPRTGGHGR